MYIWVWITTSQNDSMNKNGNRPKIHENGCIGLWVPGGYEGYKTEDEWIRLFHPIVTRFSDFVGVNVRFSFSISCLKSISIMS